MLEGCPPQAHPAAFRRDVVAIARRGEASPAQVAKDFGISKSCVQRWGKAAEVRELRKRNRLLEQENAILRRAAAYLSRDLLPR